MEQITHSDKKSSSKTKQYTRTVFFGVYYVLTMSNEFKKNQILTIVFGLVRYLDITNIQYSSNVFHSRSIEG